MARIRTIKPDFWSDERIVGLSPMARLFFIGMWNFADDHGGIERSPRQLKMKVFPGDDVEVEPLVQELLGAGMVVEYEVDGALYLNIKNFLRHQRINRPSTPRIPAFKESVHRPSLDDSTRARGGLSEDSVTEGKGSGSGSGSGREGKGSGSGREGRGPGRGGKSATASAGALRPPLAAPLQQGADRGKGTSTASGKKPEATPGTGSFLDFTDSLSLLRREALQHAINMSSGGALEEAIQHLKAAGFEGPELSRAQGLLGEGAAN
jgi:hypothetical protein